MNPTGSLNAIARIIDTWRADEDNEVQFSDRDVLRMVAEVLAPAPHPLDELVSALRAQWDALRTHKLTPGGIRRHAGLTWLVGGLADHLGVPAPTTSRTGETR